MSLPVYIPSRSRWTDVKVLPFLMAHDSPVHLVVPSDQFDKYRNSYPNPNTSILGCPLDGIAAVRAWIGQHAAGNGASKFVMMDDDLREFVYRKDITDFHLTQMYDARPQLKWLDEALDTYAHAAISVREGNNRHLVEYITCGRAMRVLAYQTGPFNWCEHGRVDVMEDFDVTLQLLRRGFPNIISYRYAQGQPMTQAKGGCSDYRSHEVHEASAKKLAELHHPFVRLREKKNKTGGSFGSRLEVTIYWQKAFASSQS